MSQQPAFDPVQQGVSLALDAHRRGFVDDRALDAILAYYDAEGAVDPFPPAEVLTRIGGVSAEQLRALFGQAPARTPSEVQGQRFGDRLTLLEPIGEGGMGTVYRAYDRVLKRVVAVKRVRVDQLEGASKARALSRFEREAMAMARVRHPACVQIFDAGLTKQGEPYLVMEFVAGKSLRAVVEEHHTPGSRPLDPRQVATWGAAIADALQACHDVGLVHRDVKPANVLLDAQRHPRLTDFGVALDDTARTKLTVDKAMVGTLTYMAPEQALGEAVDARSDVYALGVTLYELLTGRPPFDGVSALVLMRQVLSVEPAPVRKLAPRVPVDLETIVMKCLAKVADDRYATAQALSLDLRRYLADEPVLARPVSASRRLARRLWRARRLVGAVGAVALGALVVTGVAHVRAREAQRARIDAALEAAAIASDIDAAEQEVLPLVAIAAPDQAERAREALRQLRGRRRLREAEAAFERWKEATARAKALLEEADALKERIDPRQPYAESEDKKRLVDIEEERRLAEYAAASSLMDVERLSAQAAVGVDKAQVNRFRALVLVARARQVEFDDPDEAERLFLLARAHDSAGGGALTAELAEPSLSISSEPSGEVTFERYEFDRDQGIMVPCEIARGRTPCTLRGRGAGSYRISVRVGGHFVARDLVLLTRGHQRNLRLRLIPTNCVEPFASLFVHIPGGTARSGEGLRARAQTEDLLMQVEEVSYEQWRSFHLATDEDPAVSRAYVPTGEDGSHMLSRSELSRWPAMNVSWRDARRFTAWFERELELTGASWAVTLPSAEEFARAVRGELPWVFPWGTREDGSFCTNATGRRSGEMNLLALATYIGDDAQDSSGFGLRRLAGSLSELVGSGKARSAPLVMGGTFAADLWALTWLLTNPSPQPEAARVPATGFRLVLRRTHRRSHKSDEVAARTAFREALRCIDEGDLSSAFRNVEVAIRGNPVDHAGWIARGNIRRMRGDSWGAIWDYSQALRLKPGLAAGLVNRGLTLADRGDCARALQDFDAAIAAAPNDANAWAGRALALVRLGRVSEAAAEVNRALSLEPSHENAQFVQREIERALRARGSPFRGR